MGKTYLRMKTDSVSHDLINADFKDLTATAKKLATHAVHLRSLDFGTTFLEWVALLLQFICRSLIGQTGKQTSLYRAVDPIHFLQYSFSDFLYLHGSEVVSAEGEKLEAGLLSLRLYCDSFSLEEFPEWAELLAALILLMVVAPSLITATVNIDPNLGLKKVELFSIGPTIANSNFFGFC